MNGHVFGNYVVRDKIGEGGMGEVFLAEHRLIGRKAAIKVLRGHGRANAHEVQRFFNEARAASMIEHPAVVQIFDCDFHEDGAYLIMEYLDGESLAALLRRSRGLSADPNAICSIGTQIANALAAAHAKGIVHRDLKPDNVFLEHKVGGALPFVVRILDFGIAKLVAADVPGLTKSGMLLGTPMYMAPEQCAGDRDVDTRADIYSLGCILFEMATGTPPFERTGAGSLINAHMSEPPPSVSTTWPSAPPAFAALVAQMLNKDPTARPQTMAEVELRLSEALSPSAPRSTLAFPTVEAMPPAPTLALADSAEGYAGARGAAADPTALLSRTDSVPAPTVALPTGNGPRTGDESVEANRVGNVPQRSRHRRMSLAVAAAVAAIGLAVGFAGARRKNAPAVLSAPAAAPTIPMAPAAQALPEPKPAPIPTAPIPMPAPAEETVEPKKALQPPAQNTVEPARRRKSLKATGKMHPRQNRQLPSQQKREIRGFSDF